MPSQMKNIYFAHGIYGINTFFNEKSRLLLPWERWLAAYKIKTLFNIAKANIKEFFSRLGMYQL